MANEIRAKFNLVSGTLSGALTNVATSMSSAGLANLGVIDTTNHAAIVIENEIVWVTAHTSGATTATILRAQEGTAAAAHNSGVAWVHGPTALDENYLTAGAWLSYTPTLTQSVTVTKTVNYAKYMQVGKLVVVQVFLSVTGAGTAANAILVGLPVTAAQTGAAPQEVGTGAVLDSSLGQVWKGQAILHSTTDVWFRASGSSTNVLGTGDMTAALASGDQVSMTVTYEAA